MSEPLPVRLPWGAIELPEWLSHLIDPHDAAGATTSAVLILSLLFLLPKGDRRLARGPFLTWCAYVICLALHNVLPRDAELSSLFEYLALFLLLCTLGRCLFLLVVKSRPGRHLIDPWPKIFLDIVQGVIYLGALLVTLNAAGVTTGSLVTGSALVTAALGLSMKDTLGNIFAGLAIHAEHPFEVGDWIEFDDKKYHIGEVLEINWRATKVLTLDKVEVIVPNGQLAQTPIRNFTKPYRYSRRSIYVVAPYEVPPQLAHRLILEAITGSFGVLSDPAPSVVTNDFTERGVEYWVRLFTYEFHMRDRVDGAARDRIWYMFQRHGIDIPGPLRQVQLEHRNPETEAQDAIEDLVERKRALQQIDFLDELPEEAYDKLAARSQRVLYAPGETVIRQGTHGDDLFIIHRGEVAINIEHDGRVVEVGRMGAGQFFGELSLMTGQKRSATVTAVRECELYVVGKQAFAPILEANPELASHISEVLSERQAQLERHSVLVQNSPATASKSDDLLSRIRKFFSI